MKHMMKFVVIAVLVLGVASCDLFNVDVETTLSGVLDIQVDEGAKKATIGYPFYEDTTLNPRDNKDVDEYADKIVEVIVDNVILEVDSVSETGVIIYAGSTITLSQGNVVIPMDILDDWPISKGTSISIDDLDGAYDAIADILTDVEVFHINATGNCSHTGVKFSLRLDIETVVTGNPF